MKRTPIIRKTPMPTSTAGLARAARIRPRSAKTEQVYREARRPLVARLLADGALCEARLVGVCQGLATEVHELLSRARGGSIVDPANCLPVCSACHRWVTTHPAEAEALDLARSQFRQGG